MKLRKYISYVTVVMMFAFAGFGSFYIVTGENLITGQKRDGHPGAVLSETDSKDNLGKIAVENKAEEKPQYTEERMFFDQVMSKTEDKTSLQLEATSGGEAAVFYRFGSANGKYYLAVFASGITSKDVKLYAWLLDIDGKDKEIGELKILDNTDVYKLAIETDTDLSAFITASVTASAVEGDAEKYTKENVVYTADFDFTKELAMEPLEDAPVEEVKEEIPTEDAPAN